MEAPLSPVLPQELVDLAEASVRCVERLDLADNTLFRISSSELIQVWAYEQEGEILSIDYHLLDPTEASPLADMGPAEMQVLYTKHCHNFRILSDGSIRYDYYQYTDGHGGPYNERTRVFKSYVDLPEPIKYIFKKMTEHIPNLTSDDIEDE